MAKHGVVSSHNLSVSKQPRFVPSQFNPYFAYFLYLFECVALVYFTTQWSQSGLLGDSERQGDDYVDTQLLQSQFFSGAMAALLGEVVIRPLAYGISRFYSQCASDSNAVYYAREHLAENFNYSNKTFLRSADSVFSVKNASIMSLVRFFMSTAFLAVLQSTFVTLLNDKRGTFGNITQTYSAASAPAFQAAALGVAFQVLLHWVYKSVALNITPEGRQTSRNPLRHYLAKLFTHPKQQIALFLARTTLRIFQGTGFLLGQVPLLANSEFYLVGNESVLDSEFWLKTGAFTGGVAASGAFILVLQKFYGFLEKKLLVEKSYSKESLGRSMCCLKALTSSEERLPLLENVTTETEDMPLIRKYGQSTLSVYDSTNTATSEHKSSSGSVSDKGTSPFLQFPNAKKNEKVCFVGNVAYLTETDAANLGAFFVAEQSTFDVFLGNTLKFKQNEGFDFKTFLSNFKPEEHARPFFAVLGAADYTSRVGLTNPELSQIAFTTDDEANLSWRETLGLPLWNMPDFCYFVETVHILWFFMDPIAIHAENHKSQFISTYNAAAQDKIRNKKWFVLVSSVPSISFAKDLDFGNVQISKIVSEFLDKNNLFFHLSLCGGLRAAAVMSTRKDSEVPVHKTFKRTFLGDWQTVVHFQTTSEIIQNSGHLLLISSAAEGVFQRDILEKMTDQRNVSVHFNGEKAMYSTLHTEQDNLVVQFKTKPDDVVATVTLIKKKIDLERQNFLHDTFEKIKRFSFFNQGDGSEDSGNAPSSSSAQNPSMTWDMLSVSFTSGNFFNQNFPPLPKPLAQVSAYQNFLFSQKIVKLVKSGNQRMTVADHLSNKNNEIKFIKIDFEKTDGETVYLTGNLNGQWDVISMMTTDEKPTFMISLGNALGPSLNQDNVDAFQLCQKLTQKLQNPLFLLPSLEDYGAENSYDQVTMTRTQIVQQALQSSRCLVNSQIQFTQEQNVSSFFPRFNMPSPGYYIVETAWAIWFFMDGLAMYHSRTSRDDFLKVYESVKRRADGAWNGKEKWFILCSSLPIVSHEKCEEIFPQEQYPISHFLSKWLDQGENSTGFSSDANQVYFHLYFCYNTNSHGYVTLPPNRNVMQSGAAPYLGYWDYSYAQVNQRNEDGEFEINMMDGNQWSAPIFCVGRSSSIVQETAVFYNTQAAVDGYDAMQENANPATLYTKVSFDRVEHGETQYPRVTIESRIAYDGSAPQNYETLKCVLERKDAPNAPLATDALALQAMDRAAIQSKIIYKLPAIYNHQVVKHDCYKGYSSPYSGQKGKTSHATAGRLRLERAESLRSDILCFVGHTAGIPAAVVPHALAHGNNILYKLLLGNSSRLQNEIANFFRELGTQEDQLKQNAPIFAVPNANESSMNGDDTTFVVANQLHEADEKQPELLKRCNHTVNDAANPRQARGAIKPRKGKNRLKTARDKGKQILTKQKSTLYQDLRDEEGLPLWNMPAPYYVLESDDVVVFCVTPSFKNRVRGEETQVKWLIQTYEALQWKFKRKWAVLASANTLKGIGSAFAPDEDNLSPLEDCLRKKNLHFHAYLSGDRKTFACQALAAIDSNVLGNWNLALNATPSGQNLPLAVVAGSGGGSEELELGKGPGIIRLDRLVPAFGVLEATSKKLTIACRAKNDQDNGFEQNFSVTLQR